MRDDDVRSSCFAALDVLQAVYGTELPYTALTEGFTFRGRRVPFFNRAFGIYRASVQRGPAPRKHILRPDPIRLAQRFERFLSRV